MIEEVRSTPVASSESVRGTNGIVCAGHPLTSLAAQEMLLSGGNAFDAVVAAGWAAAVVEPTASYSLGAECVGLFYHAATDSLQVLSGQGVAPSMATTHYFHQLGLDRIPTGPGNQAHLAFTVPGAVGAYLLMLEKYGTKSVEETMQKAIEYSEAGFPVYDYMHEFFCHPDTISQIGFYSPGFKDTFYAGGRQLSVDEILKQPQLGKTLRRMAEASTLGDTRAEQIRAARRIFYTGEVGQRLADFSEQLGGLLTQKDLARYEARFEEPLAATYAGFHLHTQGSWTQGAVLLQALNMLEPFDLLSLGHNTPSYIHLITEVLKLVFSDREHYYGDPDFAAVPIKELLSKDYAVRRLKEVGENALVHLPPAGDCGSEYRRTKQGMAVHAAAAHEESAGSKGGTTHFAAIDRDGNMACITASGGSLSKSVFISDLGFAPSTRSEMFVLEDDHPNRLQPGKRPRTTLVNYIVSRDGAPFLTLGCPGGDDQAQANLQVLLNLLVFKMSLQQAVSEPRFSTQSLINSFYPRECKPGQLNLEEGIPPSVAEALTGRGHRVHRVSQCGMGAVAIQRDHQTGVLTAGADPRRPTCALAW